MVRRLGVSLERTWREWQYTQCSTGQYRTGQDSVECSTANNQKEEKKSGKRGHCYFGQSFWPLSCLHPHVDVDMMEGRGKGKGKEVST